MIVTGTRPPIVMDTGRCRGFRSMNGSATSRVNRMMPPHTMPGRPTQFSSANVHQNLYGGRVPSRHVTGVAPMAGRQDGKEIPSLPSSTRPIAPMRRRWWVNGSDGSPDSVGLSGRSEILWYSTSSARNPAGSG